MELRPPLLDDHGSVVYTLVVFTYVHMTYVKTLVLEPIDSGMKAPYSNFCKLKLQQKQQQPCSAFIRSRGLSRAPTMKGRVRRKL